MAKSNLCLCENPRTMAWFREHEVLESFRCEYFWNMLMGNYQESLRQKENIVMVKQENQREMMKTSGETRQCGPRHLEFRKINPKSA